MSRLPKALLDPTEDFTPEMEAILDERDEKAIDKKREEWIKNIKKDVDKKMKKVEKVRRVFDEGTEDWQIQQASIIMKKEDLKRKMEEDIADVEVTRVELEKPEWEEEVEDTGITGIVAIDDKAPMQEQLQASLKNSVILMNEILLSIKKNDLTEMSVEKKLNALSGMKWIFSLQNKSAQNKNAFTQININTSSREEMENALLNLNQ